MGDRVERLHEVYKTHIEWLLVLACLVHQYSEIHDLVSCPLPCRNSACSSITRKFQSRLQCIQSATGENLTEAAQITDKWKGYCEEVHHDEEGKGTKQEYREQEPPPLRSEVARAICQTASRKATGEVPAELFKARGETVLDRMHIICVAIWETGEWPEEWTFSAFITLSKKSDLKKCENYTTIALVSYASMIHLWIILVKIRVKRETENVCCKMLL